MNLESFRKYCISKKGVTEEFPFDENTLVFKVMGKMFALTDVTEVEFSINLKCDPERAIELREQFAAIAPGWHMNKKHWNTVTPDISLNEAFLKELTDHSYELVVNKLTKKDRIVLENM